MGVYAFVVAVDPSWDGAHLPCCVCGREVPWREAVLLPTASCEDGDVTGCAIAHRECPATGEQS